MELSDDGRDIKNFEDARINVNEDCRICLQKSNETCQLFPNNKGFSQKLMAIAGVQVEEGDGLPSVICFDCSQLLDISYNFRSQIQKTDTKLREILKLGSCTAKDIENELKVEDHFSNIIADAILQRKVTNNIGNDNKDGEDDDNGNRECSSNIHEPSIQIDVQSFPNDQHDFASEIINDNIDSNDKCNSIIELENKQEEPYKVVENIKLPQSCETITNKINSVTCHSSNLITETECIKEDFSRENNISESNNSIDQSIVRQEQIFKLEIKNELEKLNYNTLIESSSKIINIQEEGKPIYNCSDDEEKPLISRTTRQKCSQCIKSFTTRLALQRHMTVHKHKAEVRYVCYICDKQFSNITKLKNHINSRHHVRFNNKKREKENSDNKDVHFKAEDLDNNCNNSMDNTKTEKKNCKFICKVCSKQFTYQKSFLTHAKSHPEYNPEDLNDFSSETGTQLNEIKNKSVLKQNESDDGNNDDIDDIDNDDDNDNDNLPMESPQCTQCGKLFATKRNLKRHISTHSGLKYNCSTCGKVFSRIDKLKDHEQSKHKDEIFGNSEEENEDDTDNENKVNDGSNERKKGRHNRPHKCALCPKAFAQQQSLANHIERHKRTKDSQKRFLCEVCSKCFAQSGSLVAHMRTHTGIKPYVCNICSRAFTKSTYLQLHSRTHSGEKPYICQYCSRAFARANTLARHITMHTGEAKYHCQICTKSFRRLTSLNEHTYTHTGQRPYACKICTKRYNNAGSLYAHTKKCKAQQLSNSTTTFTLSMDNSLPQSGGPTSQVLIYSQRKLLEDATVGQITPTPQYMIANVHNQKALSTNIMQPFTVEDPNVCTVNSKQLKNSYYSIYPNV
ncbi:PREDICTED: zinc finger protein 600-like [Polistes canadensis]|uniref:zinc finger protein 600-like n=1 Tax=Polistes canadensis TaxID=91411 RepID=UPI000718EFB8|nr:PREDICTED: zinc finger protein 600-like [Polistes canadensis]